MYMEGMAYYTLSAPTPSYLFIASSRLFNICSFPVIICQGLPHPGL